MSAAKSVRAWRTGLCAVVGVALLPTTAAPAHADAALGTISTAVGTIGDGGAAANAFIAANYLATDPAGNIYVTESNRVRKIAAGTHVIISIVGNGSDHYSGDGGAAVDAGINPYFVAVASNGDLYISDSSNHRVRKVTVATGIITTVAGTGVQGSSGDGGQATAATLNSPAGLALDSAGNLLIADSGVSRVRKVTVATGIISNYAGTGIAGFNSDNVQATTAQLSTPIGLAIDPSHNLYIADSVNNRIRKVTAATGLISTVAGTISGGFDGDGTANAKKLNKPEQIVYSSNYVYIIDRLNQRLRRVSLISNSIFTLAGNGTATSTGDGGLASAATLDYPKGLAVIGSTAYVTDKSSTLRAVSGIGSATVTIDRFAGIGAAFAGDGGPAQTAVVGAYLRFAVAPNGDLLIADGVNNRIRKVSAVTADITTIAGSGTYGYNGDGPALTRNISPTSIAVDPAGNVFIGLDKESIVLKLTIATGMITTVAGAGDQDFNGDGPALTVNLVPGGLAADSAGNIYIADSKNNRIRKLTVATGTLSTVAGNGLPTFNGDGPVTTTQIHPEQLAVDANGDVFFSDVLARRIRKVSVAAGTISTLVGTGLPAYNGNQSGLATNIQPEGIALDALDNIYFAEESNHLLRRYDHSSGMTSTVAGTGAPGLTGDGGPATAAKLLGPVAVALDGDAGRLYVSDDADHRIRAITIDAVHAPVTPPAPDAVPAYNPVTPERLLDTRVGVGAPIGKLPAGDTLALQVTGAGVTNVPSTAVAVALNVTVTEPDADGYLTVWPCGQPQPFASNLNYSTGETIPNLVIAKLGTAGTVCITGQSTTHVVADVNGWFAPSPAYAPVTPERLLDTRDGIGAPAGTLASGSVLTLQVTGAGATNVPVNATAAVLNVTVTEPDSDGYLTVWPCDQDRPLASNLNYSTGETIPNLVIAKLSAAGTVCIVAQATTHVVADINGYFLPSTSYTPAAPERLLDTRTGVGAPAGQLAAGSTLTLQVTGAGSTNVPATATAVAINITVTGPDADGYLTVWPCGAPQPLASNLNYSRGETIPNLVLAKLGTGGTVCIAGQATTDIVADINGWFS